MTLDSDLVAKEILDCMLKRVNQDKDQIYLSYVLFDELFEKGRILTIR